MELAIKGGKPLLEKKPFTDPIPKKEEIDAVLSCLNDGYIADFMGQKKVKEFEQKFAKFIGIKHATALNSGTAALHVALDLLGVGFGDNVIVPAYTWVTVATSVIQQTAMPRFADISLDNYGLTAKNIEEKIDYKTKAILLCHLYGIPSEIEKIKKIADEKNIPIIEDCAQSLGATVLGKKLGTIGALGCFSFQLNKSITSGEGGMVVSNDSAMDENAKIIRKGGKAGRTSFPRMGYNYRVPDVCAAIGIAQLEKFDKMEADRRRNIKIYKKFLKNTGLIFPKDLDEDNCAYTKIPVLVPKELETKRDYFVEALNAESAPIETGYPISLYKIPYIKEKKFFGEVFKNTIKEDYSSVLCPNSEEATKRTINLISTHSLGEETVKITCEAIKKVLAQM
ncbi:MAG: DegT/DnrJ/EryC1/StrS family aminotransferase [Sphaerochaetaceae bacterium]|nr:DegT/DnrJ/EryC1/StrS family aminotransferase [Sphaerochaetaceae bacterium]